MCYYYVVSGWFSFATLSVLLVKCLEPLNDLLLYGKTSINRKSHKRSMLNQLTNRIMGLTVRKANFLHFYIWLFCMNAFGLWVTFDGGLWNETVQHWGIVKETETSSSGNFHSRLIIAGLLLIQSIRRIFECLFVSQFSKDSRINILHYIAGVGFYFFISLNCLLGLISSSDGKITSWSNSVSNFQYFCIAIFVSCSMAQFRVHYHLATLKKYSLPSFSVVSSPHYLCEILLYLMVALISISQEGFNIISNNYLFAWVFVLVNLSISSLQTHEYYKIKYKDEFQLRWSIIPMVL